MQQDSAKSGNLSLLVKKVANVSQDTVSTCLGSLVITLVYRSEQAMGHSEWPMTQVTHWALDPWPMWPMTNGSPWLSPHTSASLTQIYRLPGTVFGHCICIHTFTLLHNCTCKQTAHTGTCKFSI